MKQVSENTAGGRIRKVRVDNGMTLRDFSAVVGISPNHLSLVELGDKAPSISILKKVAGAMNIPFDWLRNGASDNDSNSVSAVSGAGAKDAHFFEIDARLFLSLIMVEDPDMTQKDLAYLLHTDETIVNEVLSGNNTTAARDWTAEFSSLAKRLDMPAMSEKLRTLASYLEHEAEVALYNRMRPLIQSLKDSTEANGAQNLELAHVRSEKKPVPYYCVKFLGDIGWSWEFRYVQDVDMKCIGDIVETIMGNLPLPASVSIVFDDRTAYGTFIKLTSDYIKKVDALACPAHVSAILIDGETYAVIDKADCWPLDECYYAE